MNLVNIPETEEEFDYERKRIKLEWNRSRTKSEESSLNKGRATKIFSR